MKTLSKKAKVKYVAHSPPRPLYRPSFQSVEQEGSVHDTLQTTVSQRKSDAVVENVRELIQVRIGGRIMKEQVKNNLLIRQELVNDRI